MSAGGFISSGMSDPLASNGHSKVLELDEDDEGDTTPLAADSAGPPPPGPPPGPPGLAGLPARPEPPDPLDLPEGTLVEHFRIKRLLDSGGMGRVYLARDQSLGRQVALKFVRPDHLHNVGRFLDEAQFTATCSHENIVTIHSVGTANGVPYLALEYLEGESLYRRSTAQPLSVKEIVRIASAVASALEHAHQRGIIHRDLKPHNIMIPKDGRVRVVDFGLARASAQDHSPVQETSVLGTPRYMAPEQWAAAELTLAADVFALGVILFELIEHGRHPAWGRDVPAKRTRPPPFDPAALRFERKEAGPALRDLVRACLAHQPASRPSAAAVAAELKRLAAEPDEHDTPSLEPFRGLYPFLTEHARDFFGRDNEIAAAVERLREETFLTVIGPSGGGKSSFVRAGIIARMSERGRIFTLDLRPGSTPLRVLARHLVAAQESSSTSTATTNPSSVERMAERLQQNPTAIAAVLAEIARREDATVILYVDALEEVFTQGATAEEAGAFIGAVCAAADDPHDPVRVLVSMREDFLGRLPPWPSVQRAFSQVVVIRNLERDQLRRVITAPLAQRGYRLEDPQIVEQMLDAVASDVAGLPMLEFACQKLWEQRDPNQTVITRAHLEAIGGVTGALAIHAEEVLRTFRDDEQRTARDLFLALVNPNGTRRTQPREALVSRLGANAPQVIERLVKKRLLTRRRGQDEGELGSLIDLAHESLIHRWTDLVRWLEESREELILRNEIEPDIQRWSGRGRQERDLWDENMVLGVRMRLKRLNFDLSAELQEFLRASEEEVQRKKRRLKLRSTAVIIGLATIAVAAIAVAVQAYQIDRAAADIGQFQLVLEPFDWNPETMQAKTVDPAELTLDWRLYEADKRSPGKAGPPMDAFVKRTHVSSAEQWIDDVEAPSKGAVLEVFGRGRKGQTCGSSWIPILELPGFSESQAAKPALRLRVPTCEATRAGTREIAGGEFIRGGDGEPRATRAPHAEETVELATFAIDETEVSNAAFTMFALMGEHTGFEMPNYHTKMYPLDRSAYSDSPVTNLNATTAEVFCRYMGKRLPSSDEWAKAARGGKFLDGIHKVENLIPRRSLPWGREAPDKLANLAGEADGFLAVAPVRSFPGGRSPYGLFNMAGNVYEWTSTPQDLATPSGLRIIRGGSWASEAADELHFADYENSRDRGHVAYDVGVRCAVDAN